MLDAERLYERACLGYIFRFNINSDWLGMDVQSVFQLTRLATMRIVIISSVYSPEPVVSAQIGRHIAQYFAEAGHVVTVLCPSPSRPAVADYSAFKAKGKPKVMFEDGVEVVRLPSYTAPQSKLLARLRESYSFGRHAYRYLKANLADVDVVYVNCWPLASQAFMAAYSARSGIPMVMHIDDIYPESLMNKLPVLSGIVGGLLTRLDRWSVSKAAHVITISDNMRNIYIEGRGLAANKVTTVLNWVDDSQFEQMPENKDACERYGVDENKFTFLFLGNIGPIAGVDLLIDGFHEARLDHAQLVIAGDGSSKPSCVERVAHLNAKSIHFISDPDVRNVPLLLSLGRVCLLPMKKGAGLSSIPSKIMGYLMAAKPVLATVDAESDTADCINKAGCGWIGEPEHVEWLAGKMREVATLPMDELHRLGMLGRAYAMANFSKTQGVKCVARIMETAAKKTHPAG